MDYYQKYLKYKKKYNDLKLKGGFITSPMQIWFKRRTTSTPKHFDDECIIKSKTKFSAGGQSEIFMCENESKLIRTINIADDSIMDFLKDIPKEKQNEILLEENFYSLEVYYAKLLTKLVNENVNPHFVISYNYFLHGGKIFHLMERFDGDFNMFKSKYPENYDRFNCYEQLLFAAYTLMFNEITITDINPNNIYFKDFKNEFYLCYILNEKKYYVKSSVFFVIGDYGKARPLYDYTDDAISDENKIKNCAVLWVIQKETHLDQMDKSIMSYTGKLGIPFCEIEGLSSLKPIQRRKNLLIKCIGKIIDNNPNILKTRPTDGLPIFGPFIL